jgi:hypothetical protein
VGKTERLSVESDPEILGGKPPVAGTTVPVSLLELLDAAVSPREITKKCYFYIFDQVARDLGNLANMVRESFNTL